MDSLYKRMTYEDAQNELAFCDSYSRLPTLLDISWRLDDRDFLRILGEEWSSFDNIGHHIYDLWDTPFGRVRNAPFLEMMTPEELDFYNAQPELVTIYRGCYKINKWGLSWTLSKDTAENFPTLNRYRRANDQALLVTATAFKKDIIALKLDRDESEIITWRPKHVSTRHIKTINDIVTSIVAPSVDVWENLFPSGKHAPV